jgi:hypothetical protein
LRYGEGIARFKYACDRVPPLSDLWAVRSLFQIIGYRTGVKRAQFDSRGSVKHHSDTVFPMHCIAIFFSARSENEAMTRLYRLINSVDSRCSHFFGDLIESIQDRQDQVGVEKRTRHA